MTLNRLQFLAAWLAGLAVIFVVALRTPSTASAAAGTRAPVFADALFETADAGADSQAAASILSILAPEAPAGEPADQGAGGELAFSNLPDGEFSRPSVAAIVEERGVFTVYLRDVDGVIRMGEGEVWREWRITEVRPDRVYFESEENPFQFRVFTGIEGPG